MNTISEWFESLDRWRRAQGLMLDRMGLGRRESAYAVVFSRPGLRLRCYGEGDPILLIVPAPIKRPYIWDLSPDRSVVRRAIERGFAVYLVEWTDPDGEETSYGVADYAGSMLASCVDEIAERSPARRIFLAAHSLGGTLAALHTAYRGDPIAGLVLLEAPLHFAEASGAFAPLIKLGVPASSVMPSASCLPGSLLSLISAGAAPDAFQVDRYLDYLASLMSKEDLETHWRVERWTLDEFALPRRLFEDVVEQLYREDRFMRGELMLGDVQLHPRDITSALFVVYEPASRIIPRESILAFYDAAGSREKELVPYFGDSGVALKHVGPLVGHSAHSRIWPRIFDWVQRLSAH